MGLEISSSHPHGVMGHRGSNQGQASSAFGRSQAAINHFMRDVKSDLAAGKTTVDGVKSAFSEKFGEQAANIVSDDGNLDRKAMRDFLRDERDRIFTETRQQQTSPTEGEPTSPTAPPSEPAPVVSDPVTSPPDDQVADGQVADSGTPAAPAPAPTVTSDAEIASIVLPSPEDIENGTDPAPMGSYLNIVL